MSVTYQLLCECEVVAHAKSPAVAFVDDFALRLLVGIVGCVAALCIAPYFQLSSYCWSLD